MEKKEETFNKCAVCGQLSCKVVSTSDSISFYPCENVKCPTQNRRVGGGSGRIKTDCNQEKPCI